MLNAGPHVKSKFYWKSKFYLKQFIFSSCYNKNQNPKSICLAFNTKSLKKILESKTLF